MKKILLLPGLGDIHWVLLKLQSWLETQGPEWAMPEVSIWDIDNRPRSICYLDFIPWLVKGDYFRLDFKLEKKTFDSLYLHEGSSDVVFNFHGFDALIGTNGNMRNGVPFTKILSGAAINYDYGPVGLIDLEYGRKQKEESPYFVLCFSGFGMFASAWCRCITPEHVKGLNTALRKRFPGHRFIYTGLAWDDEYSQKCLKPWDISLVNQTSLSEFLSLLLHSSAYIGWCGGNSILAQHLGVPTVEWWSRRYFPKHDRIGWETPNRKHLVLEVEDYRSRFSFKEIVLWLEEACG